MSIQPRDPGLVYLAGDHHVHSVYSADAKYSVAQLAAAGTERGPGLDGLH